MSRYTTTRTAQNIGHGLHLFRNRKTLWQMIHDVFGGRYKMSFLTIGITVAAIAYVIFPFDLVPDYIPFAGWIDDGLVIYLSLRRLVKETQRYNRFKAIERKGINRES